ERKAAQGRRLFELEGRPQLILHRLLRRLGGGFVVAEVGTGLDTGVLVGERLTGRGTDHDAGRLFLERAPPRALRVSGYGRRLGAERIVIGMMRVRILDQLRVASGRAQSLEIGTAWRDRTKSRGALFVTTTAAVAAEVATKVAVVVELRG